MYIREKHYLYGSLMALPGSPQRHPQQWIYPCISTLGKKLYYSSVINDTYLSQVASARRVGGTFMWAGQAMSMPQETSKKCIHNSPTAAVRETELRHAYMHTRKHTAKRSRTMRKGDGRTPCNSRWANFSSPTSARRKMSHLWQFPLPTCS